MTREQTIARTFVELADTLVADFDALDFLHTLNDRCVEVLEVDAAGLMLSDQRGLLQVVASSTEAARMIELFEVQHSEGPCYDCFHSGRPVVNIDLAEVQDRWPNFRAECLKAGFRSVHALPMRLRGDVIGAINLFCCAPRTLSADDVAVGQAMADVATIGLLQERIVAQKEVLAEQLQAALNTRILVEQAKGVLAERSGMSVEEAFTTMRTYARSNGRRLSAVAMEVIDGSSKGADVVSE